MSKHTSAPLIAVREDEYKSYIETPDGRQIGCAFGSWEDPPEQHATIEANAKLWSVAPELLETLQLIANDTILDRQGEEYYKRILLVHRDWCRTATAKAEGNKP